MKSKQISGERPETRIVRVGRACIWRNAGTEADVEKARAYAATEPGYRVFVYPTSEREPLVRARKEVVSCIA